MSFIRIAAAEELEGGTLPQDCPRFGCCSHQIWCANRAPEPGPAILLKVNHHCIRGDVERPNPAAAPRSEAFSRAIRPGVRGQSPRGA